MGFKNKMSNLYINELISKLENTEIWRGIEYKYKDYNKGIQILLDLFTEHKRKGSQVFFVGNGGSAAIASHMTADFMKNGGMNTYSLYDTAVTTCMGNDYGYENIFSKPMKFLMKPNDLLIAISSSGNSVNIINAIITAKEKGAEIGRAHV